MSKLSRKKPNPEIKKITGQFSNVLKGIGKVRDNKNDKDFYAKFRMKTEAVPVAQTPRSVAYYLQESLKKWLGQCIETGVFQEVPEEEQVTRFSPLVVHPKPKF